MIRPYSLVVFGRDWMVLAQDESDDKVKNFYLARIDEARSTGRRYAIPRDHDPEAIFRNTFGIFVGGGKPFRFRVRFSPEISEEVRELQFHPKQKIETGPRRRGDPRASGRVAEAKRASSCSRTASDAVAISPPELVEELRRESAVLNRAYSKRSS